MLNKKMLVSMIAIVCCAQAALGAASVRTAGGQNASGTVARAGTLRTGTTKVANITPKTSVSTATAPSPIGRMTTATGGVTVGNKPAKMSGTYALDSSALDELERQIDALTGYYDRLQNQYDRLSSDVNYAATTATAAKTTAENDHAQIAQKMNEGDFNVKFDTRLSDKQIESNIGNLANRVVVAEGEIADIKANPGIDTGTINELIDEKTVNFVTRNDVTMGLTTTLESAKNYADTKVGMTQNERDAFNTLSQNVTQLADTKLDKSSAAATYTTKQEATDSFATKQDLQEAVIGGQVDLSEYTTKAEFNTLAGRVEGAETSLGNKVDTGTYSNFVTTVSGALNQKADASELENYYTKATTDSKITAAVQEAQLAGGDVDLSAYETSEHANATFANKTDVESNTAAITALQSDVANKADKTELSNKVDAQTFTAALENKPDIAAMNTAISAAESAAKAYADGLALSGGDIDMSNYVTTGAFNSFKDENTTALNDKVDTQTLTTALAGKADAADVYNKDTANATFTTKDEFTAALTTKADKTELSNKVDAQTFTAALENKPDIAAMNTAISAAESAAKAYADGLALSGGDIDMSNYVTTGAFNSFKEENTTALSNKVDTQTFTTALADKADAANVYDKEVADGRFVKANDPLMNKIGKNEEDIAAIQGTLGGKLDANAPILSQINTNADNIASLTANKVNKTELDNYYKITDANAAFAPVSLVANVESNTTALNGKVDTTAFNSFKDENTTALGNKVNNSTFETAIGTLNTSVAGKADAADVYNKDTANAMFAPKTTVETHTAAITALQSDVASKADTEYVDQKVQEAQGLDPDEIQAIVENYVGTAAFVSADTFNQHVTNANATFANKDEVTTALTTKADKTELNNYYKIADANATFANKDEVTALSGTVGTHTNKITANENAIASLDETKADKDELDNKVDAQIFTAALADKADTANVYDMAAADARFVKANDPLMNKIGKNEEDIAAITTALNGKVDTTAFNSFKDENTTALENKVNNSTFETAIGTLNTSVAGKADAADVYNKDTANAMFAPKTTVETHTAAITALQSDVASKADTEYVDQKVQEAQGLDSDEIQAIVENYVGTAAFVSADTFNQHVTNANATFANKDEVTTALTTKADKDELDNYYKITDANAAFANKDEVTALSGTVDTHTNKITANENAIESLNENKVNKTELDSAIANKTYTKTEADSKFATLTALDQANGKITENINKITENTTDIASLTSDVATAATKADDAYTLADSAVKPSALSAYLKTADFGTALTSTTNKTAVVNAVNSSGVLTSYLTSANAMNTYATKAALNDGLVTKANANDVYTKTEVDNTLNNYPTSSEVAALVTQASMCSGTVVVTSTEATVNGVRGTNFEVTCAAPKTQD